MGDTLVTGDRYRPGVTTIDLPPKYDEVLAELKRRVQDARLRAHRAVNVELIRLYWQIGRAIWTSKQQLPGAGRWSSDWRMTCASSSRE